MLVDGMVVDGGLVLMLFVLFDGVWCDSGYGDYG